MTDGKNRRSFLGACLAGGALASSPAAEAKSKAATRPQGVFNVQDFGGSVNRRTAPWFHIRPAERRVGQLVPAKSGARHLVIAFTHSNGTWHGHPAHAHGQEKV